MNILSDYGSGIGLKVNPAKSDTMQWVKGIASTGSDFHIDGTPIRKLSGATTTRFLGKPIGRNTVPDGTFTRDLANEMELIRAAKLAPWQKLDALQQFIIPRLPFPVSRHY